MTSFIDLFDQVFLTVIVLIGTPLNTTVFLYCLVGPEERTAVRVVRVWITFVDVVICFLTVISAVSSFSTYPDIGLFEFQILCNIHGVLGDITRTMALFLIALLSASTAIALR